MERKTSPSLVRVKQSHDSAGSGMGRPALCLQFFLLCWAAWTVGEETQGPACGFG